MLTITVLLLMSLLPQDDIKPPHPGVDQMRVNKAIKKGETWLLQKSYSKEYKLLHKTRSHELVLYTLLHSGADQTHPTFQKLLKEILEPEMRRTYNASLQAMALQKLNAGAYQQRIAQCCQYLVDNQCGNGQWSYGDLWELPPTRDPVKTNSGGVKVFGSQPGTTTTKTGKPIRITPAKKGPATGDNSNSQYAALGLRACMEANVMPPSRTLALALNQWERDQHKDGGWGYKKEAHSWGSMTAGAIASIVIYRHYLKKSWKNAASVNGGIHWMAQNFTVNKNPGYDYKRHWLYYYLYAMERTGILANLDLFGEHDWYLKGANELLSKQGSDGSWPTVKQKGAYNDQDVWDTCFAILFLARATRPMVASGSK